MAAHQEIVKILKDLAATCRDAEEGYNKAAKGAHSDELRALFDQLSIERAAFAAELDHAVKRYGGEPGDTGHGSGPLRRGWKELEARIRPKSDPEFAQNAADGEEGTVKHYDHALASDLPDDLRPMLERHLRSIREVVSTLRAMGRAQAASAG